jgi:hypothetical protein
MKFSILTALTMGAALVRAAVIPAADITLEKRDVALVERAPVAVAEAAPHMLVARGECQLCDIVADCVKDVKTITKSISESRPLLPQRETPS